MLSKVVKISLFNTFDNNTDRYHPPKNYHAFEGANTTINETDNRIEILPCPPLLMNMLCWSLSPETTLSCPPAWIMDYNLTNNNLRSLALNSKICLANNQWYQNLSGASWRLCAARSAFYIIDDTYLKYSGDLIVLLVRKLYFSSRIRNRALRFKLSSSFRLRFEWNSQYEISVMKWNEIVLYQDRDNVTFPTIEMWNFSISFFCFRGKLHVRRLGHFPLPTLNIIIYFR